MKLSWVCAGTSTSMKTTILHKCIMQRDTGSQSCCISDSQCYHGQFPHSLRLQLQHPGQLPQYTVYVPAQITAHVGCTFLHRVLRCHPPFNPPVTVLWNTLFNLYFHTYNKTLLSSHWGETAVLICFVTSNLSLECVFQQCFQIWCQWGLLETSELGILVIITWKSSLFCIDWTEGSSEW